MYIIYKTLSKLGYKLSSSTTPIFSIINSPIYKLYDLIEMPSSGYINNPLQIIDSWSIKSNMNIDFNMLYYEFENYLDLMNSKKFICNVYFDGMYCLLLYIYVVKLIIKLFLFFFNSLIANSYRVLVG